MRASISKTLKFAAALAAIAIASAVYWHAAHGPIAFDHAEWMRTEKTPGERRERMADGLVESKILVGKTKAEIEAMLGVPPPTNYFKDSGLVYCLGPERGFMSIDNEWLIVKFDAAGRAAQVAIVTD